MDAGTLLAAVFGPVEQDYLGEARQMQALSFAIHIPLVCFGIAFPAMVLFVESLYLRTGDPLYRTLARRWSKVMIALFAAGVVTGTILSFEMGLLWPGFMARFGDVFGLGFTLEGFSFFVEAIFIAIYVYGWDRLSVHAWMNNPQGFALRGGEVVDAEPWAALFGNPHLWPELTHMYLAGYIAAGFLVAGAYAWRWLRGERTRYVRTALVIPLTIAALAAPVQVVVGDWVARRVAEDQPLKLAALEGLGETTAGAPVHVGGWYQDGKVRWGVEIPRLLSVLARHDPDATLRGLESVPPDDRPPVNVVRVAFQLMVAIGFALLALGLWHLIGWWRRRRLPSTPWFFRAVVAAAPLSVVALIAGWVTTEVGRQPWVVYEVMRTEEAVTGAAGIPVGYATLVVVYAGLIVAVAWILRRLARVPLDLDDEPAPEVIEHAG